MIKFMFKLLPHKCTFEPTWKHEWSSDAVFKCKLCGEEEAKTSCKHRYKIFRKIKGKDLNLLNKDVNVFRCENCGKLLVRIWNE